MNSPHAVILSYGQDEHALSVLSALPSWYSPLLVDVGREGVDFVTSLYDDHAFELTTKGGKRYDLTDVKFWWLRRPRFRPQPSTEIPYANAQETEVAHFWNGIFGMQPGGHWCNPPQAHFAAQNKLRQIFLAKDCGLVTPKTLWSNDPDAIKDFWSNCDERAVIKMFEGSEQVWQPTRLLTDSDLEHSKNFRFSHSIVQEIIDGDREYRVIMFGDNVFSVASDVGKSRYPYDTRIDTATKQEVASIPSNVLNSLLKFKTKAQLSYCAFDIREDRDGNLVFLENNPMGQFLYLDRVYGGEILKAFAAFMVSFGSSSQLKSEPTRPKRTWVEPINVPYFTAVGQLVTHIID